jgi:hypothetical protein
VDTTIGGLNAFSVQVRFQSTDAAVFSAALYGLSSPAASPTVSPTVSAKISTPAISSSNKDRGLSVGARAGVGISVALVVIALILGAFLLYRRRKARPSTSSNAEHGAHGLYLKPELDSGDAVKVPHAIPTSSAELDITAGATMYEMHTEHSIFPAELPPPERRELG